MEQRGKWNHVFGCERDIEVYAGQGRRYTFKDWGKERVRMNQAKTLEFVVKAAMGAFEILTKDELEALRKKLEQPNFDFDQDTILMFMSKDIKRVLVEFSLAIAVGF